jgi:hypothetical protein
MHCLNISGEIIRACTRACFGPNKSGKGKKGARFRALTRFPREPRAGSTAVSVFSSNHTNPAAWPANDDTIHITKRTAPRDLMLLEFKRVP